MTYVFGSYYKPYTPSDPNKRFKLSHDLGLLLAALGLILEPATNIHLFFNTLDCLSNRQFQELNSYSNNLILTNKKKFYI
jgi:hypothetical protein